MKLVSQTKPKHAYQYNFVAFSDTAPFCSKGTTSEHL